MIKRLCNGDDLMGIWIIIIFGVILRLLFINKPEGLWNDEYVSWYIASKPLTDGFIENIKSQCHMPFYYLYLKFFMTIFGQSDLVLRLTSVLAGTLSIPVMYLCGLEKDKKTGLVAAGLTALSSFLIYYSQEVRIYAVLFLFSALSLLFTLRLLKEQNKKNLIGLIFADFMILFTHTIGFVFVFFNILLISAFLFKNFKKVIIALWSTIIVLCACVSPLVIKIFTTESFSQWWGGFTTAKFGFLMTDYFSPVLTNLVNSPERFFYNPSLEFIIFACLPALIAAVWIIKSLMKNKINTGLFLTAVLTVFVLVMAAISGKLVFITKYSVEIYPVLIFLAAFGAASINNKFLRYSLITIFCLLHAVYLIASPISAPKIKRAQGHAIVAELLHKAGLKKDDIILLEYYPQARFEKYMDFSNYKVISVDKGNFASYMAPDTDYAKAYKDGKTLYKDNFASNSNPYLKYRIFNDVVKNMKNNQSVAVVMLNSVAFYPSNVMMAIASDDALYRRTPLLFLVFSHIKTQVFNNLSENLTRIDFRSKGDWAVIKFTKLNKLEQE